MDSDLGWQQKAVVNLLQEDELRAEREFQLNYSWSKLRVSKKVVISKQY